MLFIVCYTHYCRIFCLCIRATSMSLFASFMAVENLENDIVLKYQKENISNLTASNLRKTFRSVFRKKVLHNLHSMGVKDPLLSIQKGGMIGNETVSTISSKFLGTYIFLCQKRYIIHALKAFCILY